MSEQPSNAPAVGNVGGIERGGVYTQEDGCLGNAVIRINQMCDTRILGTGKTGKFGQKNGYVVLPRGAAFDDPEEKRAARKQVLATELVRKLPPRAIQHLLDRHGRGFEQVNSAAERASALARIVLAVGGPSLHGAGQPVTSRLSRPTHSRHSSVSRERAASERAEYVGSSCALVR